MSVATSGAIRSPDRRYRYVLWRQLRWDEDAPDFVAIMLNPSTADEAVNDPTIRRCLGFANRERAGRLVVVNLFAMRATDPAELERWTIQEAVGPDNLLYMTEIVRDAASRPSSIMLAAWGANWRADVLSGDAYELVASYDMTMRCLGTTKSGAPRHPLYVRADAPLVPWEPA